MRHVFKVVPAAALAAAGLVFVSAPDCRAQDGEDDPPHHEDRDSGSGEGRHAVRGAGHRGRDRGDREAGREHRARAGGERERGRREMMMAMRHMRKFEERLKTMDRNLDRKLAALEDARGEGREKALAGLVRQLAADRKEMDRARIRVMDWMMAKMRRHARMGEMAHRRGGDHGWAAHGGEGGGRRWMDHDGSGGRDGCDCGGKGNKGKEHRGERRRDRDED